MIIGERVVLRALEREDLPKMCAWRNDPEAIRSVFSYLPISQAEEDAWFERYLNQDKNRVFVVQTKEGINAIGYLLVSNIDHKNQNAEIGIHIDEKEYQGQGLGTDAMKTLLRFLFGEMNLHRAYLYVHDYNERAINFYKKMDFKKEGVLRKALFTEGMFCDILLLGILREEFTKNGNSSAPS